MITCYTLSSTKAEVIASVEQLSRFLHLLSYLVFMNQAPEESEALFPLPVACVYGGLR